MSSSRPSPAFLGRGWSFPIAQAVAGTDVVMAEGAEDVRQSILLILQTAPGERPMRPNFGCGIHRLVFASMNSALLTRVRTAVEEALVTWEPRIDVHSVSVEPDRREQGRLLIDVRYAVRATNTFYNLVYPFYLQEERP